MATVSSTRPITTGFPQDIVLGPLLYTLYIADLSVMATMSVATFKDDTALLAFSQTYTAAVNNLQLVLNAVHNWTKCWKIKLNN